MRFIVTLSLLSLLTLSSCVEQKSATYKTRTSYATNRSKRLGSNIPQANDPAMNENDAINRRQYEGSSLGQGSRMGGAMGGSMGGGAR